MSRETGEKLTYLPFNKYSLSSCYVSGTVPGIGTTAADQTGNVPALMKLVF